MYQNDTSKRYIEVNDMKRAVIYFSLSGNTKEAAEYIAASLNADIYVIEMLKKLPDSTAGQMMKGGMQSTFGMRPEITGVPKDITSYDEIILGCPIWAGKAASPVNTLLADKRVADKITYVFTFSGGGDNDKCIKALSKQLSNLKGNAALADRKNELSRENKKRLEDFTERIKNG